MQVNLQTMNDRNNDFHCKYSILRYKSTLLVSLCFPIPATKSACYRNNQKSNKIFHYVFGSGWSSSEAELSFVSSWDGMMVSWPAIIMSIVRLSLMSMVVVSVRNLGWHPAAPAPRVWSFSLSTCVASRAVWSLNMEGVRLSEARGGGGDTLKCKIVQKSDHKSKLWNVQNL